VEAVGSSSEVVVVCGDGDGEVECGATSRGTLTLKDETGSLSDRCCLEDDKVDESWEIRRGDRDVVAEDDETRAVGAGCEVDEVNKRRPDDATPAGTAGDTESRGCWSSWSGDMCLDVVVVSPPCAGPCDVAVVEWEILAWCAITPLSCDSAGSWPAAAIPVCMFLWSVFLFFAFWPLSVVPGDASAGRLVK